LMLTETRARQRRRSPVSLKLAPRTVGSSPLSAASAAPVNFFDRPPPFFTVVFAADAAPVEGVDGVGDMMGEVIEDVVEDVDKGRDVDEDNNNKGRQGR
jgi:hypothetical protein